jgi:hypothetical protein
MPSPEHQPLATIGFHGDRYSLSLDRIIRHDDDGRTEYAFGWRNPNNSVLKIPAYFNWQWAGQLIRQAVTDGKLEINELEPFVRELISIPELRLRSM